MATEYEILEDCPDYCAAVADLAAWSQNHDYPKPFALFLDIIGWSDEQLGEPQFDLNKVSERFGYLEIGKLADALAEYADRPQDVSEWVTKLCMADSE